jgi:hypothetical protein
VVKTIVFPKTKTFVFPETRPESFFQNKEVLFWSKQNSFGQNKIVLEKQKSFFQNKKNWFWSKQKFLFWKKLSGRVVGKTKVFVLGKTRSKNFS